MIATSLIWLRTSNSYPDADAIPRSDRLHTRVQVLPGRAPLFAELRAKTFPRSVYVTASPSISLRFSLAGEIRGVIFS